MVRITPFESIALCGLLVIVLIFVIMCIGEFARAAEEFKEVRKEDESQYDVITKIKKGQS